MVSVLFWLWASKDEPFARNAILGRHRTLTMTDVRDKVGITTLGGNIAPLIGRAFAHGRDNCSAPQPAEVTRILAHWRFFWMGACLAVRSGQMGGVFSFRWVRRYIKSHCWGGLWEGNSCCVWVPSRLCYIPCSCAGPVKWFRFFFCLFLMFSFFIPTDKI